jgi:hypothetical protein
MTSTSRTPIRAEPGPASRPSTKPFQRFYRPVGVRERRNPRRTPPQFSSAMFLCNRAGIQFCASARFMMIQSKPFFVPVFSTRVRSAKTAHIVGQKTRLSGQPTCRSSGVFEVSRRSNSISARMRRKAIPSGSMTSSNGTSTDAPNSSRPVGVLSFPSATLLNRWLRRAASSPSQSEPRPSVH